MKYLFLILALPVITVGWRLYHSNQSLGATVIHTVSSDTFNTFRTNVNTSLDNLNTAIGSVITSVVADYPLTGVGTSGSHLGIAFGTTTSQTWAGTQTFINDPVISAMATFGLNIVSVTNSGTLNVQATSTLYGTGTAGQVLSWTNGKPGWVATSTAGGGGGSTITRYYSEVNTIFQIPVVNGDTIEAWENDALTANCNVQNAISAAINYKHSTFAATNTSPSVTTGRETSADTGCTAVVFYSLTATTTETINIQQGGNNLLNIMAEKIH